jgi:dTDP-4-dehydrorhamnose reductase
MDLTAYLTGMTGTVAPVLATTFQKHGYRIVGKHHRIEKDEDISKSLDDLTSNNPTTIVHLALGPIAWAKSLALWAHQHQKTFVYVSTASVYDDQGDGPYTIYAPVYAKQGYGLYKFQCEQAVKEANPNAYIVRIGWQIDPLFSESSNNMFRFFAEQICTQGKIVVSNQFFPSASFLPDTTQAIYQMIKAYNPGL